MADTEKKMQQRVPRQPLNAKVEFIVDSTDETANSVDISAKGMSFITEKPVRFRMRLNVGGELKEFLALLVWAKKEPAGTTSYGFQFIPDDDNSSL